MSDTLKDCGRHRWHERHRTLLKWLGVFFAVLVIVVVLIILIIWLVLRPTKPDFYLENASVSTFNLSTNPGLLTTILQVTLSSRNPNDRVGIYYDRLDVYASYKLQRITVPVRLQSLYQGQRDVREWCSYLYGMNVPIAPLDALTLWKHRNAGAMILHVKINGQVRWKAGSWVSSGYHLFVDCPAYLTFDRESGDPSSLTAPLKFRFQRISHCHVDV